MIERPVNVLKLLGDYYNARVYSLLAKRFHLDEWEQSIRRSLEVIEGVYAVISDLGSRTEPDGQNSLVRIILATEAGPPERVPDLRFEQ